MWDGGGCGFPPIHKSVDGWGTVVVAGSGVDYRSRLGWDYFADGVAGVFAVYEAQDA